MNDVSHGSWRAVLALLLAGLLMGCGHHHRFAPDDHTVKIRLHRSWARHHAPVIERQPLLLGNSPSGEGDVIESLLCVGGDADDIATAIIVLMTICAVVLTIEAIDMIFFHQMQSTTATALVHDADPPYAVQQLGWGRNTVAIPAEVWNRAPAPTLTVFVSGKRHGQQVFEIDRADPRLRLRAPRRGPARGR